MIKRIGAEAGIEISRRAFTQAGLATAGLVYVSAARATEPPTVTAESPMGPFYPLGRPSDSDADLTLLKGHSSRAAGQVVQISGRVLDRLGNPIPNAAIDLWQANAAGRYDHPLDVSKAPL